MEVVGGLKVENELIKSEYVVEIRAEDIQEEIKQENGELVWSENVSQITSEYIHDEELTDDQKDEYSSSDEDQNVQEKLILNYKDFNLNDVKKNCNSPPRKCINNQNKQVTFNEKNKQSPRKRRRKSRKINSLRVLKSEYTMENGLADGKKYSCKLCQVVVGSKRRIIQHIRQNHRDITLFENKEEKLQEMVNNTKSRYFAWFEYTVEDQKYRCGHCQSLYKYRKEVEYHILENHRKMSQWKYCPHCSYKSFFDLNSHIISVHTDVKDIKYYSCDKCEYKAKLKPQLRRHIQFIHRDQNEMLDSMYKCNHCNKLFKRNYVLRNHINVIHNADKVKKINCFHCSFQCRSRDSMKHHIDSCHTNIEDLKTLECSKCNFKTKFRTRLSVHMTTKHKSVLQCHICSYQCRTQAQMNLHLIGHKKEKNEEDLKFRCDICEYKTYRSYNLKVHQLNHLKPEEIQYFHCYHCTFKAKRKDNLKSHIFRHFKQNEVNFVCYICNFTTQKRHIHVKHVDGHSKEAAEVKIESKFRVTIRNVSLKEIPVETNAKIKEIKEDDDV